MARRARSKYRWASPQRDPYEGDGKKRASCFRNFAMSRQIRCLGEGEMLGRCRFRPDRRQARTRQTDPRSHGSADPCHQGSSGRLIHRRLADLHFHLIANRLGLSRYRQMGSPSKHCSHSSVCSRQNSGTARSLHVLRRLGAVHPRVYEAIVGTLSRRRRGITVP